MDIHKYFEDRIDSDEICKFIIDSIYLSTKNFKKLITKINNDYKLKIKYAKTKIYNNPAQLDDRIFVIARTNGFIEIYDIKYDEFL